MYFIYFLLSIKNGKLYIGLTSKVPKKRLLEHNIGSNKWTKENGPFNLIYYEKYYCKKNAQAREIFYKSGFGSEIKNIIISRLKEIKGI